MAAIVWRTGDGQDDWQTIIVDGDGTQGVRQTDATGAGTSRDVSTLEELRATIAEWGRLPLVDSAFLVVRLYDWKV